MKAPDDDARGTPYAGIDNLEVLAHAVRYNRFLVDTIVGAAQERGKALDFGAGTGSLSTMVRDRGFEVACVETDARLRERLRSQGFRVYDDVALVPDRSYAFIYTVNVLEHIEDDAGTLRVLLSKLEPGGRCLVYVPALGMLYSSMDRKIGHYRRYHRAGFVRVATQAGFAVERAEYADSLGFFATLVYKLVGSRQGDLSTASVRLYDRFVFPMSRVFDRMGCSRVLGKNLVAVIRRPGPTGERA
ncbi:MAG TPA: class I SAM-dependent methyltransferase [Candidatus Krumholzibacteria bacterium]|nr:class I SAM-dependent methyltransferase [Candidatus Krumholzibacteria bacterium]